MTQKELAQKIKNQIEWLETTEGDEIECISIENLEEILSEYLNRKIKLSADSKTIEEKVSRFKQLELF